MRGSRIPTGKRVINSVSPLDPSDYSEANANNLMFLWDNMGSGDYLNDAAILVRHLQMFLCQEQASPNMTLSVQAGNVWFGGTFLAFAGGNTPSFTAPSTHPRIDVVCIDSSGTVSVITGAENASPVAPAITAGLVGLCQVYHVVGETDIHDNDTQVGGQGYILYDVRPFMALGGTVIKRIQKVSITLTFTGVGTTLRTTNTAAITSVDTTKAFVIFDGIDTVTPSGITGGETCVASVVLTNATTVTSAGTYSTLGTPETGTCIVRATVVEFQ